MPPYVHRPRSSYRGSGPGSSSRLQKPIRYPDHLGDILCDRLPEIAGITDTLGDIGAVTTGMSGNVTAVHITNMSRSRRIERIHCMKPDEASPGKPGFFEMVDFLDPTFEIL